MEYIIPVGAEAPKAPVRDVSADIESAKLWLKANVTEAVEVHEARKSVQEAFPSLINDEAFAAVQDVKAEWDGIRASEAKAEAVAKAKADGTYTEGMEESILTPLS
jgi:hypothetical protein